MPFSPPSQQASNCKGWALKQLGLGLLVAESEGWDFPKSPLLPVVVTLYGSPDPTGSTPTAYPEAVHLSPYALLLT